MKMKMKKLSNTEGEFLKKALFMKKSVITLVTSEYIRKRVGVLI